jgi:hypothetical protein
VRLLLVSDRLDKKTARLARALSALGRFGFQPELLLAGPYDPQGGPAGFPGGARGGDGRSLFVPPPYLRLPRGTSLVPASAPPSAFLEPPVSVVVVPDAGMLQALFWGLPPPPAGEVSLAALAAGLEVVLDFSGAGPARVSENITLPDRETAQEKLRAAGFIVPSEPLVGFYLDRLAAGAGVGPGSAGKARAAKSAGGGDISGGEKPPPPTSVPSAGDWSRFAGKTSGRIILTAADLASLNLEKGGGAVLPAGTRLTPMARDEAAKLGLVVETETGGGGGNDWETTGKRPGGD